jgi:hypothetical protein
MIIRVMHTRILVVRSCGEGFFVWIDHLGIHGGARGAGEVTFAFVVEDGVEGHECCADEK